MCHFNNPLVTLPSFTTTGRSGLTQLELPRCSAKLQSTIFFYVTHCFQCVKWSHLKVWISTFLAFLVVSMFLLLPKGKFFSVRTVGPSSTETPKKTKPLCLQGGRYFRCQISYKCRNVYSRQRQQPAFQLNIQTRLH